MELASAKELSECQASKCGCPASVHQFKRATRALRNQHVWFLKGLQPLTVLVPQHASCPLGRQGLRGRCQRGAARLQRRISKRRGQHYAARGATHQKADGVERADGA